MTTPWRTQGMVLMACLLSSVAPAAAQANIEAADRYELRRLLRLVSNDAPSTQREPTGRTGFELPGPDQLTQCSARVDVCRRGILALLSHNRLADAAHLFPTSGKFTGNNPDTYQLRWRRLRLNSPLTYRYGGRYVERDGTLFVVNVHFTPDDGLVQRIVFNESSFSTRPAGSGNSPETDSVMAAFIEALRRKEKARLADLLSDVSLWQLETTDVEPEGVGDLLHCVPTEDGDFRMAALPTHSMSCLGRRAPVMFTLGFRGSTVIALKVETFPTFGDFETTEPAGWTSSTTVSRSAAGSPVDELVGIIRSFPSTTFMYSYTLPPSNTRSLWERPLREALKSRRIANQADRTAFFEPLILELNRVARRAPKEISEPIEVLLRHFSEHQISDDDPIVDAVFEAYTWYAAWRFPHMLNRFGTAGALTNAADLIRPTVDGQRVRAYIYRRAINIARVGGTERVGTERFDERPPLLKLAEALNAIGDSTASAKVLEEALPAFHNRSSGRLAGCGDRASAADAQIALAASRRKEGRVIAAREAARAALLMVAESCRDLSFVVRSAEAAAEAGLSEAIPAEALQMHRRFADAYEQVFQMSSNLQEPQQRYLYRRLLPASTSVLTRLTAQGDQASLTLAFEILLSRSGRLLESLAASARRLPDIARLRSQRVTLALRGTSPLYAPLVAAIPGDDLGIDPVLQATLRLLMREDWAFDGVSAGDTAPALRLEDIRRRLPGDAVALCYFVTSQTTEIVTSLAREQYGVMKLHASGEISFARVGDRLEVDGLIKEFREILQEPGWRDANSSRLASLGRDLAVRFLEPVLPHGLKRVVIVPDGAIGDLPFGALRDANGRYVAQDLDITYSDGLRHLARAPVALPASAAVVAGYSPDLPTSATRGLIEPPSLTPPVIEIHGVESEVETIAQHLRETGSRPAVMSRASEGQIKALKSPSVLHIAAHAVSLEPHLVGELKGATELAPLRDSTLGAGVAGDLDDRGAMMRTFLVLSEYGQVQPPDEEDGILTPLEVVGMELDRTSLVVLSACHSALGPALPGGGIFSLRSAFAAAGARAQIATLWRVDDQKTTMFMDRVYERIGAGIPALTAVMETQRQLINDGGPDSDPYFWAAFTGAGMNAAIPVR